MAHLLGVDVGTSSVRAAVVDGYTAEIVAIAAENYPLHIPGEGIAEQDPDDWWRATVKTVRNVVSKAGSKTIDAIGFSGQMHGTVLLDANGKPVQNAIIWADQRGAKFCDLLIERLGEDTYTSIAGTRPAAGFQVTTLMWIAENRRDLLERACHIILPKDYVRYRMIGTIGTDVSDAAGTGLFDIRAEKWSDTIINATSLPRSLFPNVNRSHEIVGEVTAEAAELLGLPRGIPVVAGCADQPAQALGNGILRPNVASITVGSGGQVFLPVVDTESGSLKTDGRIHIFNNAAPGYYALGAILSAGLALRWLRDVLGLREYPNAYALLSSGAASVRPGAEGLVFLPYLHGERTPHMDACARGAFIGLGAHHQRGHMARAVMEGIAFALRQVLEICEQVGQSIEILLVAGGGMESSVWRQILADVLNRPLQKSAASEQAVVGAAMLASVGLRLFGKSVDENFSAIQEVCMRTDIMIDPLESNVSFYGDRFDQYNKLYDRLRDDMHLLAGC